MIEMMMMMEKIIAGAISFDRLLPFFRSFIALFLTAGLIKCVQWIVKALRQQPGLPLPPGPRGLPIVGYLPFLGTEDLHVTFKELADRYGPVYKLWLGNKLCVVLSSPEAVREVVRDKDVIFANRDSGVASRIIMYGGNDIVFLDYGPEWRTMRKIFAHQMLGNSSLEASYGLRRDAVKNGVKEVYARVGSCVDIGYLGLLTVINSMAAMIGGKSFLGADGQQERAEDDGGSGLREILTELMVLLGTPNVSDFFPALARLDLQGIETRAKRVFTRFDGLIDKAITQSQNKPKQHEEEVKQGEGSTDFLQRLLGLQEGHQDSESSLSLAKIKAMLIDTMVGGTDTTATVVEWTLTELILHPQVMKKVQDELSEVVGLSDLVEEPHLEKLKYLDAAVKETMRLHTPVPLLVPRRPVETTEIGGYRIPKDARIFTNVWAIQRDPSLWDNPLDFRPERFLNSVSKKWDYSGNNMQYLPFGSGRRMCPGFALAEKSVMYTVASFLHCFNWQIPEGVKIGVETKFGIVLKKRDSLVAIPTPRLPNLELYA